jgi:hypothetical protein
VAVSLIDGGIAAEAVKISLAVHIPDVDAGAFVKDDGKGVIIVGAISLFEFEIMKG